MKRPVKIVRLARSAPRGVLASALALPLLAGCGSGGAGAGEADPHAGADALLVQASPALARANSREEQKAMDALEAAWARRDSGSGAGYEAAREEVKRFAWAPGGFPAVRAAAIDLLLSDPRDADGADARTMLRLMLPTERNDAVRDLLCRRAAERGWKDATPAIVRAWSSPNQNIPDRRRVEYAALARLHGEPNVERAVWEVFATPPAGSGAELDRATRARTAAWEVLSRLDPDGARRTAWLAEAAGAGTASGDPMVDAARACARDLRCVPVTSEQLEWVVVLASDPVWWDAARRAVGGLDPSRTGVLALRHLEAIRWSAAHRPQWLALDRESLLDELRTRVNSRQRHPRTAEASSNTVQGSELISDNAPRMTWGDALTALVIDHAVHSPGLGDQWWQQVQRDHADTSTEYGGVLESLEALGTGEAAAASEGFRSVLYPPRPTQRFSDDRFVASQDMLNHSGYALAHYHFHAKDVPNTAYAGPGGGDMMYAATLGRACLVVTPLREGVVNVDYYHAVPGRGGAEVRIDLGEVAR